MFVHDIHINLRLKDKRQKNINQTRQNKTKQNITKNIKQDKERPIKETNPNLATILLCKH